MQALTLLAVAAVAWAIPSPETAQHPAVTEAPASDPRTYADETGFAKRAKLIIDGLKGEDLSKWRRGYFAGGDPGKYLPGAAMAKLIVDPSAADVRKYMNDGRSYKESYHFAVVNWGRFLPLFGSVLTDETQKKLADHHGRSNRYFNQGGTENHKIMWLAAAAVLPHYVVGNRFSGLSKEKAIAQARDHLRTYVKGLYAAGQGEWDSSTYLMFDLHGMLNIYDFSKDEDTRLIAKAALDWYAAGYALKYRDGAFTAPNQRGFAKGVVKTIGDQTGWLWWGLQGGHELAEARGFRYAMHAATSSWRPGKVLCKIAQKKLPGLPVEQRNTKPNYWYGLRQQPRAGVYHETVYIAEKFTVGTLWNGHGSQMTRFMVAVESDRGAVVFTGGNPRKSDHRGKKTGIGFADGNCRYTQFAAMGPTVMSLSRCPGDDKDAAYSFFTLPEGIEPKEYKGWQVMAVGDTTVAVYPLGGQPEIAEVVGRKNRKTRMLKIRGHDTGFVVHVGKPADLAKMRVTADSVTSASGKVLKMTFSPATENDAHGNRVADVAIDGKKVDVGTWPIYSGPFVTQRDGVLTVSDGQDGYTVDFTGDLPVYGTGR